MACDMEWRMVQVLDTLKLNEDGSVHIAAGRYYIGDPLRLFDEDDWAKLLKSAGNFIETPLGRVGVTEVAAFHTARGDGWYECDEGVVPVDSGLIGIVSAAIAPTAPDGMITIEIEDADTCRAIDGTLWFGQLKFETQSSEEDEDDAP